MTRTIVICCLLFNAALRAHADDSRQVMLDGQSNFRDLGGYTTSDGRTVRRGHVYRSGELHELSDRDVSKLQTLGVRTVISFLTDDEIRARGEDRLPEDVEYVSLPIAGGDGGGLVGVLLEARQNGDFSKVPVELNPEIHRLLTRDARHQYAALLRQIIDSERRPLVFHCSHGVHRTGTAAAIVLSALGVPWETVREDYLLSNKYREDEVKVRLGQLRQQAAKKQGIPPEDVDMTNIAAFYILQPSYIDASLDEAVRVYGSMEAYIRDGLAATEDELRKLRASLLE